MAPGIFQGLMDTFLKGIFRSFPSLMTYLLQGHPKQSSPAASLRSSTVSSPLAAGQMRMVSSGHPKIEFLGYLIDADNIQPTTDKVKATMNKPSLISKQELQVFFGLLNLYHSLLPHKVALAKLFLDKKTPWVLGHHKNAAFQAMKTLLTLNSVLAHFSKSLSLVITFDASLYGISTVLSHKLPNGCEMAVAYYS